MSVNPIAGCGDFVVVESVPLQTPTSFAAVFDALNIEKIDHIMTKLVYTVDWPGKGKVVINVLAKVTRLQAQIIGYIPVTGVAIGACRLSVGVLQLGLTAASLGACQMLGLPIGVSFGDVVTSMSAIKQGIIEISPLAVGLGAYLVDHTPSVPHLIADLKVTSDKWGVLSEFCHSTAVDAASSEKEKYQDYKPWAKTVMDATDKTYVFATEGAECMVTCAAWGNLALGVGALATAPFTRGATLPYAVTSLASGALALGASTLLALADEYEIKGRLTRWFYPEDEVSGDAIDGTLLKLMLRLQDAADMSDAYEAIDKGT